MSSEHKHDVQLEVYAHYSGQAFVMGGDVTYAQICGHIIHFIIHADIISHSIGGGVTHGMSLEGSQTGNSSGCFQDLLVCLSERTCECIYSDFIQSVLVHISRKA